jgi:hypothetical protein
MSQNEPTDFITQSLNDLLKDLEDNLVNDKSGQRVIRGRVPANVRWR